MGWCHRGVGTGPFVFFGQVSARFSVAGSVQPMGRRHDTISFLSDYGTVDESAGIVRAVLRDLAPHAHVVDLTHDIAPFDVRGGSLALARAISFVPEGVVLAVVDPAVGTARKAIAVEVADGAGVLVGPDNGLLVPAVSMAGGATRAVVLTNTAFHVPASGVTSSGRDVFAPVAAHLCNGVDLAELGEVVDADTLMPGMVPLPRDDGDAIVCEVLWIDRFGNCQLNLGPDEIAGLASRWGDQLRVSVGDLANQSGTGTTVRAASFAGTFAHIGVGAVGMLVDAHGMMALVLDRRSAADELGLSVGDQVLLEPLDDAANAAVTSVSIGLGTPPGAARHR
jgi:S-adenosyl-L-methionine hydrolase (adenosine-forming)